MGNWISTRKDRIKIRKFLAFISVLFFIVIIFNSLPQFISTHQTYISTPFDMKQVEDGLAYSVLTDPDIHVFNVKRGIIQNNLYPVTFDIGSVFDVSENYIIGSSDVSTFTVYSIQGEFIVSNSDLQNQIVGVDIIATQDYAIIYTHSEFIIFDLHNSQVLTKSSFSEILFQVHELNNLCGISLCQIVSLVTLETQNVFAVLFDNNYGFVASLSPGQINYTELTKLSFISSFADTIYAAKSNQIMAYRVSEMGTINETSGVSTFTGDWFITDGIRFISVKNDNIYVEQGMKIPLLAKELKISQLNGVMIDRLFLFGDSLLVVTNDIVIELEVDGLGYRPNISPLILFTIFYMSTLLLVYLTAKKYGVDYPFQTRSLFEAVTYMRTEDTYFVKFVCLSISLIFMTDLIRLGLILIGLIEVMKLGRNLQPLLNQSPHHVRFRFLNDSDPSLMFSQAPQRRLDFLLSVYTVLVASLAIVQFIFKSYKNPVVVSSLTLLFWILNTLIVYYLLFFIKVRRYFSDFKTIVNVFDDEKVAIEALKMGTKDLNVYLEMKGNGFDNILEWSSANALGLTTKSNLNDFVRETRYSLSEGKVRSLDGFEDESHRVQAQKWGFTDPQEYYFAVSPDRSRRILDHKDLLVYLAEHGIDYNAIFDPEKGAWLTFDQFVQDYHNGFINRTEADKARSLGLNNANQLSLYYMFQHKDITLESIRSVQRSKGRTINV